MATRASKKSAKGAEASEGLSASERIDGAIAGLGDWRGERLAEIRRLIHEADAEVVEEWKWMGSPVFSHDGIFVVANAHKEKVELTFAHGGSSPTVTGCSTRVWAGRSGGQSTFSRETSWTGLRSRSWCVRRWITTLGIRGR